MKSKRLLLFCGALAALCWCGYGCRLPDAPQSEPVRSPVEADPRQILARFDREWKDYTNEPNYGDERWKLKMETLVTLVRAGPEALPILTEAEKETSPWASHSRALAAQALEILRGPPAVRDSLAGYDLSRMDTARAGAPAPDFTLADASGAEYSLSALRRKVVLLTFIIQDL